MIIRDINIKVKYVINDNLQESLTPSSYVKDFLKDELEEIFSDNEGYRGIEIIIDDCEIE